MSRENLIKEAMDSIIACDRNAAADAAKRGLAEGISPLDLLNEGFMLGIQEIGERFGRGESFLPELIMAAEAMKVATAVLNDAINASGATVKKGKMLIATVEGDVHDIGKGIVISLLNAQGIEVTDAGRDVPVNVIIERAIEFNADIIGTSALLTTTMVNQKKLEDALRERGLKSRFKTMIGGAPCTQRWADKIGADAYAEDAAQAVTLALNMLGKS